MKLHKDYKDWIKAASTPEKAAEWGRQEDKWVYAYENLGDFGMTYTLTDNPDETDCLVDKVEKYYQKVLNSKKAERVHDSKSARRRGFA